MPGLDFELGDFQVGLQGGVSFKESIHDQASAFGLVHPLFKLDVAQPGLFTRLPFHPMLKNIPRAFVISDHFLHVGILVPEMLLQGHQTTSPFPDIPGVVNKFVLHLHVGVLQPQGNMLIINVECSFVNGPGSCEFLQIFLPGRIPNPLRYFKPVLPHFGLKFLPLLELVLLQLFFVHYPLVRWLFFSVNVELRVNQQLLRCYLDWVRPFVHHFRWLHQHH